MASKIALPDAFRESYTDFPNFPENISLRTTRMHRSTLSVLKEQFCKIEDDLCLSESIEDLDKFGVTIRDLRLEASMKTNVDKENLHTPGRLSAWLGARFDNLEKKEMVAYKMDPKCRFVYLSSDTSRERLNITRRSLAELFTFHQVMPTYLDFIFVFGRQVDAKDPKFGGFRELKLMKDPPRGFNIPNMGRSGRQFQLCYNLKGVVMKNDEAEDVKMHEWSIRQAAIHHQFDIVYGTTLWIVTKGRRDLYDRIKDMTSQKGREEDRSFATVEECFRSSLGAHLLYCQWAIEGWRWYVRWLENVIDRESLMAVYGPRGPGEACQKYKSGDIQVLQYWLDKTNEAVIVLQTNFEVIACLQRFYLSLLTNKDFPERLREKNNDDITSFAAELGEMMTDFGMQISRSRLLADTIRDRKGLILQHIQSEAAERTEQLNINMEREALGMRIITIVTLLFLPATFVSTFFGTDVIKYQKQREEMPGEGSFSALALKRWLQVTIPLTVFTLLLAWITYRLEQTRRRFQNRKQLRHSKRNETPPSPTFPWRSSMSFATTLNPTKFKGFSWMTKRTLSLQLPFHNSDDYQ